MAISYRKIKQTVTVPDKYICDCCKVEYDSEDVLETQEMLHINRTCGYGSVFGDGTILDVLICQYCLKQLLATLKLG